MNTLSIDNITKPKQSKIKHAYSMECTVVVSLRNMHFIHNYIEQPLWAQHAPGITICDTGICCYTRTYIDYSPVRHNRSKIMGKYEFGMPTEFKMHSMHSLLKLHLLSVKLHGFHYKVFTNSLTWITLLQILSVSHSATTTVSWNNINNTLWFDYLYGQTTVEYYSSLVKYSTILHAIIQQLKF